MRSEFLPYSRPDISDLEIHAVTEVLKSGWLTTGPKTALFESRFSQYVKSQSALALNSCTAGLHLALLGSGAGPGKEVITTPFTFAATVNTIVHTGATPVLVDVEPGTQNIDVKQIEAKITPSTVAILPVHFAGHPVDLAPLNQIASSHGLSVVEDGAHGLGATYRGKPIGSGNNPVSFSFYATKNLTTGEGGMLTGPEDFLENLRILSLHGLSKNARSRYENGGSWSYEIVSPGFKYNMTDIQSALGMVQLDRFQGFQQRRKEIVLAYQKAFESIKGIELPFESSDVQHAWHLYVIRIVEETFGISRDVFAEEMKKRNIGVSVHFIPVHLSSYYKNRFGYQPEDFPVATKSGQEVVSLPLYPLMSDRDVQDVIEAVQDIQGLVQR